LTASFRLPRLENAGALGGTLAQGVDGAVATAGANLFWHLFSCDKKKTGPMDQIAGGLMRLTVLHVITGLTTSAGAVLADVTRGGVRFRGSRQIVISLSCVREEQQLRSAGIKLHGLDLRNAWHLPRVVIQLVRLMRNYQPDLVMTWHRSADCIGTIAAIASGVGAGRVIWNLLGTNPKLAAGTIRKKLLLKFLALISPLLWGVASHSHNRRAYESLGYRPYRWLRLAKNISPSESSKSYSALWQLAKKTGTTRKTFKRIFPWLDRVSVAKLRRVLLTKITFIAVTGSCGKSVTTLLSTTILATDGRCYRGPFGNVVRASARTILALPSSSRYCIQEVSADPPGSIPIHVRMLRPHVAIVTTIGGDHYKSFRSLEATAKEKGTLVEALPRNGTAILNADDPHVRAMASRTRAKVLTFGVSPEAHIRATEISSVWPDRLKLTIIYDQYKLRVQTRLVGEHWSTSVLAAVACGIACGIDLKTCAHIVEMFEPMFGRYSIHATPDRETYILDTQKAPFWTIASGLAFVKAAHAPRKTVVFGTISDYPGAGGSRYRRVARDALAVADRVVFVGSNAGHIDKLRQGEDGGKLFGFQTSYEASAFLNNDVARGELIYVKASLADHLERIMLFKQVVCWRERCGENWSSCPGCSEFRKPYTPHISTAQARV
jgi:UDP-N-acetylmuramoyl-tripeptide--D-alanyl-D-alanine ligase